MCGRYFRSADKQRIAEIFRVKQATEAFIPDWDYNVAPSTFQPVIREERDSTDREIVLMRWGLLPNFAKAPADFKVISTINARAETLQSSPLWRTPLRKRRCLVPADGFYEWKKIDAKNRQPFAFTLREGQPFAFAGLWDAWKDPVTVEWLQSFTIVTTHANELTQNVHDRMPVILEPRDYARWLSRDEGVPAPVDLLRPFPAGLMRIQRAHKDVGNVRNNRPDLPGDSEPPG